ncbi:MAG TPA: hypothetical protein VGM33_07740 [Baekduia sp.]|jgi:hypothetical protein
MNTRTAAAGLAILATSVGLTACGSSSSSDTKTTSADAGLSKSALIAKVDAICTKAITASQVVEAPASYDDPTVAAAYFDKIAPITAAETSAIVALQPADDVKADFADFTKAQQAANTLLQTIMKKADSKDPSGLDDLNKVAPAGQAVADAAQKLGAKTCG